VAEALRDAKRRIRARREWSAPFYWAPFILTGID
jgi:CHAT domain-containing protein